MIRGIRLSAFLACAVLMGAATGAMTVAYTAPAAPDLAAARSVFERNLDAIRRHDRDAYLACYWQSSRLARTGPTGMALGFEGLAKSAGDAWPEVFEAADLRLTPIADGVVYGTYRYRVRFSGDESSGLSERLFLRTEQGWRIAMTSAFAAPPGTPPAPCAIVGGTLVDGRGRTPVRDALVIMRDGRIEYAGPRRGHAMPAEIDTVDARGAWIVPGLVDAHVHYSQTGWVDGRPDAHDVRDRHPYETVQRRLREHPEAFHRAWLASGVTAVFDVGGYPWTLDLARSTVNDTRAPHVVAAGPLLSTLDFWLNLPAERQFIYLASDSSARAGVRYLKSLGAAAVKVWFIVTPSRDFDEMARIVRAAGDEARRVKLPLIVHATGLREAKAALAAGASLLVHSVWDRPVDDEFLRLARRHGTIYCPTLTVIGGYWRLADALATGAAPAVDDPMGAVDSLTLAHVIATGALSDRRGDRRAPTPDAQRALLTRTMAANLKAIWRAGIPVAMGTDAGNPLTLHGPAVFAEMEAMQAAGMTPAAVLSAASRGGALAMGRAHEWGTVEAGKAADLVIVGADPTRDIANLRRILKVVRGGVVRDARELRVRDRP